MLSLFALGACGDEPPPCPRISILGQASGLTLYREGPGRDLTDVTYIIELRDVAMTCEYDFDDEEGDTVVMQFNLLVSASWGPAATEDVVEVPYFVATANPKRQILTKELFTARLEFEERIVRTQVVEELTQKIPIAKEFYGFEYQTFIGLQYTPDQLEDRKRERGA